MASDRGQTGGYRVISELPGVGRGEGADIADALDDPYTAITDAEARTWYLAIRTGEEVSADD